MFEYKKKLEGLIEKNDEWKRFIDLNDGNFSDLEKVLLLKIDEIEKDKIILLIENNSNLEMANKALSISLENTNNCLLAIKKLKVLLLLFMCFSIFMAGCIIYIIIQFNSIFNLL